MNKNKNLASFGMGTEPTKSKDGFVKPKEFVVGINRIGVDSCITQFKGDLRHKSALVLALKSIQMICEGLGRKAGDELFLDTALAMLSMAKGDTKHLDKIFLCILDEMRTDITKFENRWSLQ